MIMTANLIKTLLAKMLSSKFNKNRCGRLCAVPMGQAIVDEALGQAIAGRPHGSLGRAAGGGSCGGGPSCCTPPPAAKRPLVLLLICPLPGCSQPLGEDDRDAQEGKK